MATIDLSKIIAKYKNKWIALTPDNRKLIASGSTLEQVLSLSRKKGIKDPSIFKAPNINSLLVG